MYLVIDIGVSFLKSALVYKNDLMEIKRAVSPTSRESRLQYIHETNPEEVFNIVKEIIDDYIKNFADIKGVLFSTQMHGFVLVDKLKAVSPYYSWKNELDKIEEVEVISYLNKSIKKSYIDSTGMKLRSGLPSINLYMLAKNNKLKEGYSFGTIADYIVTRLTNREITTSISNAAGSGLFDLKTNSWNIELINSLNINIRLPKVIHDYTKSVGKYKNIDIYSPIGDQQAALLGTLDDYADVGISNIATGSQATVITNKLEFNDDFQTRPLIDNYYLYTIPFLPAGRALNSIISFFDEIGEKIFNRSDLNIWEIVVKYLNENIEKSDIKSNIDFFESFSKDAGKYENINENNFTLKNFLNASIESLVYNHIEALKILKAKKDFKKLYLSGGLSIKIEYIKILFEEALRNIDVSVVSEKEDALNGLKKIVLRIK